MPHSSSKLRIISAQHLKQCVPMRRAVDLMAEAFSQLSTGRAVAPMRTSMEMPEFSGRALLMPAYMPSERKYGVKFVSLNDRNSARHLPFIHGVMVLCDTETGTPLALLNAEHLTALRTGAASGLATQLLARPEASIVALFGVGTQARTQLEGVCAVRAIKRVLVFGRTAEKTRQFCQEMPQRLQLEIAPAVQPADLLQADIICTATNSATPVFSGEHVRPGTHINAIGAYRPDMYEIPPETVARTKLFVDQRDACLAEAGDLLQPLRAGRITAAHIHAEIGVVASGKKAGRTDEQEITLFKSVGNAVQDLIVAAEALRVAEHRNIGTLVEL